MHMCMHADWTVETVSQSHFVCVFLCVWVHVWISMCKTVFCCRGFFCVNSGLGNHLTSVTSCYVSTSQKGPEEETEKENESDRVRDRDGRRGRFNLSWEECLIKFHLSTVIFSFCSFPLFCIHSHIVLFVCVFFCLHQSPFFGREMRGAKSGLFSPEQG